VRGLDKSYGDKHVVQDLTIQVGTGKITGFLGPNGSGKTTTLRMLCGLLTPTPARARCWAWTSGGTPRRSSARPAT
jgi:ABC-type multidrug transport system ATPase subunit